MNQIQLSQEEAGTFKTLSDYLEGFLAGAKATADHMKQLHLNEILRRRQGVEPPKANALPSS